MEPQNLLVILAFPFAKPACFATGNSPGGALRNHLFRPVRILGDGPLKQWSKCSPGGITSVMPVTVPITSVMPVTVPSNSGASVLQGATVTDRPSCFWPALEQVVYRGARPGDQDGLLTGRTPQRGPLEGATTGEPILAAPTWPPTVVEQVVYRGPAPPVTSRGVLWHPFRNGTVAVCAQRMKKAHPRISIFSASALCVKSPMHLGRPVAG